MLFQRDTLDPNQFLRVENDVRSNLFDGVIYQSTSVLSTERVCQLEANGGVDFNQLRLVNDDAEPTVLFHDPGAHTGIDPINLEVFRGMLVHVRPYYSESRSIPSYIFVQPAWIEASIMANRQLEYIYFIFSCIIVD
jgi:hypothetical protein